MSTGARQLPDRIAQALLETRSDAILATDNDGIIQFWNAGAERIFGFPAATAVGSSLDIIIPENLRARHWRGWAHTIESGQSRYGAGELLSVPALAADGRRISVEFTIVLMKDDDGRTAGVAAILRDVTARFDEMRDLRRRLAERQNPDH